VVLGLLVGAGIFVSAPFPGLVISGAVGGAGVAGVAGIVISPFPEGGVMVLAVFVLAGLAGAGAGGVGVLLLEFGWLSAA
jgi:hypothetical protein